MRIEDLFEAGKNVAAGVKTGAAEFEAMRQKLRLAAINCVQEPTRILDS